VSAVGVGQEPVTYGAVGATQAADLMAYPPAGYRPIERRVRIGHGDARWEHATTQLFTWGVQRLSGMRVELLETPSAGGARGEALFGPDGEAFLRPGDTARLHIPFGPFRVTAAVRVIYVIDEPDRKGFAYGTLAGHPESGEEAWVISRTDDGSVWMTIRAFSRPSNRWWWSVYPILRLSQNFYTGRYERALAGPLGE
jgi:uncharacterized protein (UPF0548 family)